MFNLGDVLELVGEPADAAAAAANLFGKDAMAGNAPIVADRPRRRVDEGNPNKAIQYFLYVTNNCAEVATNLTVYDQLPSTAEYIAGDAVSSNIVQWQIASLRPYNVISTPCIVRVTQTITNADYEVIADGGLQAQGERAVVSLVGETSRPGPAPEFTQVQR